MIQVKAWKRIRSNLATISRINGNFAFGQKGSLGNGALNQART